MQQPRPDPAPHPGALHDRFILRVAGMPDNASLLALGDALEQQPEIAAVELVRADLADAWYAITTRDPGTLATALRRLPGYPFDVREHLAGVNATVRTAPAAAEASPHLEVVPPTGPVLFTPASVPPDIAADPSLVVVVAGPMRSFVELSEFQQAVGQLPNVTSVSVRKFNRGTLYLTVRYTGVVPLSEHFGNLRGVACTVTSAAPQEIVVQVNESLVEA